MSEPTSRPAVAVVMPFAGSPGEARAALAALAALRTRDGDAVVLADNSGTAPAGDPRVVPAPGERSPAHARNVGACAASRNADWLLFLDADCRPDPGLIDAFFAAGGIVEDVGALAGEIRPAPTTADAPLAARYGAARNFLDSGAHLAHPFRPRVASANLLVRRAAFDAVGGFTEGIRTAEDTDLSWRLQAAGWRLALAPGAVAEHAYRPTLRGLRAQWRAYAAGRAWLARRHPGFTPQPALLRVVRRRRASPSATSPAETTTAEIGRPTLGVALTPRAATVLDALLGVEELIGFALSNRPRRPRRPPVLPRVQAAARPPGPVAPGPEPAIDYREDDGALERLLATVHLTLVAPRAVVGDRRTGGPSLLELAPAALRLRADPRASLPAVEDPAERRTAERLRRLAR